MTGLVTDEYAYRVKAVSATGNESEWSNIEMVTLAESAQTHEEGDVNHDGIINVTDVTLLISRVLNDANDAVCDICADMNDDGVINITDVTMLISKVLNSN